MAKYDVTHACGHVATHNLIGPRRFREWKIKQLEQELCRECWLAEQRRRNEEAAAKNRADELPALAGSEKQVSWAESIRRDILDGLSKFVDDEHLGDKVGRLIERISAETRASWWIDHRDMAGLNRERVHPYEIQHWVHVMEKAGLIYDKDEPAGDIEPDKDLKVEAMVRPADPKTETVAEIRSVGNVIEVEFPERREDFRKLMRYELGFKWTGVRWSRTITGAVSGPVEERVVETAHRLLAAGFPIRLYDEELRRRAIEADFIPEPKRVIYKRTTGEYTGWFAIEWPRDEDYYRAARSLPGSRWDRPHVVVPPEQWEAVIGFSETYNFTLSPDARELVEQARAAQEAALVAPPMNPKRAPKGRKPSQTPPKLEVPEEVAIDDSLRDD